ncbi:FliO/MopB family protein [Methylibium petroleiphilum]|uniref:Flagellar biogenesis protein n=2 Tax=Methylibium TaxID=316612 RepID=A2SD97_METPP|nr:flagellar biosynthetic protein FliO [Methylibium petroleiphilum]ABM93536.1 flagellar biogenesis protein [Methylibium petroleiphilum PM1]
MSGSLGFGLLWFVVIVAAIPLALWLLKRTPYGAAMSQANALTRTVGSMALGPHQRIVTVEVGQGEERRWLVLGVTPQSITALHTLSPQADMAANAAAPEAPFAALLKKVRDARN